MTATQPSKSAPTDLSPEQLRTARGLRQLRVCLWVAVIASIVLVVGIELAEPLTGWWRALWLLPVPVGGASAITLLAMHCEAKAPPRAERAEAACTAELNSLSPDERADVLERLRAQAAMNAAGCAP